jgi:solute carrier family 25 (mitochondrial citrate transporter), member 1
MDVVKTRMMAAAKGENKYKGWIDATITIAREEGIAALWKGIIPRLARIAPGQAITCQWVVVSRIETWFEARAHQRGTPF